ncbi:MAG: AAA family ATPase [Methanotrichaceae archaeon]
MKLIGFVGMPGSGKGEASDVARSMGLGVVVMGDIIRREAARLGLELTDENLGKVGNMLRSREGPEAVARRTLEIAKSSGKDLVVIDGIRSKAEVDFFRAYAEDFLLVEIWTPNDERLNRVIARGRSDDVNGGSVSLQKRESREIGWGMNEAISQSDIRLENVGDLKIFRISVQRLLEDILADKSNK